MHGCETSKDKSKESSTPYFGPDNLDIAVDEHGIVTLRFNGKFTIHKAGEPNRKGEPRTRDLVATSGGFLRIGECRLNLNVMR